MLDICVLYRTVDKPWGGANQFLRSLMSEFVRSGHLVTTAPTRQTQVVLINSWLWSLGRYIKPNQIAQLRATGNMTPLGRLLPQCVHAKRRRIGPVLIHRVDGVAELVRGSKSKADLVQPAVNRLTDQTIFQSEFCRTTFIEKMGITPSVSRVILNAVDPSIFFPDSSADPRGGTIRLVAASWSSNPLKGFSALADLSRLPGIEMTFIGNWCPDADPMDVKLVGVRDAKGVAEVMRSSHALVHAAWNESCSNTIVEALACGLPVIYRDSGGNRELAYEYGIPLLDDMSDTVDSLLERYETIREKVLQDRSTFLIRRAAEEYETVFQSAVDAHQTG